MWKEKLSTLSPKIKENIIPLLLGVFGLILLSYGVIHSINSGQVSSDQDIVFEEGNKEQSEAKIVVDIEGAVVTPGVYSLNSDARVKDALIVAFGLSSDADREWVAKNLNQAAKLNDGAKIYIPKEGEAVKTSSQGFVSTSGLININSASSSELESLSGIGPVTAGKIIENRPYTAIDELLTKKIVGSKVFDKIKEKISVY